MRFPYFLLLPSCPSLTSVAVPSLASLPPLSSSACFQCRLIYSFTAFTLSSSVSLFHLFFFPFFHHFCSPTALSVSRLFLHVIVPHEETHSGTQKQSCERDSQFQAALLTRMSPGTPSPSRYSFHGGFRVCLIAYPPRFVPDLRGPLSFSSGQANSRCFLDRNNYVHLVINMTLLKSFSNLFGHTVNVRLFYCLPCRNGNMPPKITYSHCYYCEPHKAGPKCVPLPLK